MSIWQKIKSGLYTIMQGRHGADQLSRAQVWAGIILLILSMFLRGTVGSALSIVSMALYVWAIFRMFSRATDKRYRENQAYLNISGAVRRSVSQFFIRVKNSKQYKYFRCPDCKARLRLPRKVGCVTVTCGKCGKSFKKTA